MSDIMVWQCTMMTVADWYHGLTMHNDESTWLISRFDNAQCYNMCLQWECKDLIYVIVLPCNPVS